jgi:hypothetical protein
MRLLIPRFLGWIAARALGHCPCCGFAGKGIRPLRVGGQWVCGCPMTEEDEAWARSLKDAGRLSQ